MHPALESSLYAGLIPVAVCSIATGIGVWLGAQFARFSSPAGNLIAGLFAALGVALAFSAANARLGLAPWVADDALDWFLWAPGLVAFLVAWAGLLGDRWTARIPLGLAFAAVAAWLLTPEWQSLEASRGRYMTAMALSAAGIWLVLVGSLRYVRWPAPASLAAACAGEAVLLALTGNLRLADFATMGAASSAAALAIALLVRSPEVRSLATAAIAAHLAAASVLLAALPVYGALLNYSDYPDATFFAPPLLPFAAAIAAYFYRHRPVRNDH